VLMSEPIQLGRQTRALEIASVVMVCYAPRSGTTLVANLFDGHPQVVRLPTELTFLGDYWRFGSNERANLVSEGILSDRRYQETQYADAEFRQQRDQLKVGEVGLRAAIDTEPTLFAATYRKAIARLGEDLVSVVRSLAIAALASSPSLQRLTRQPRLIVVKEPYRGEVFAADIARQQSEARFVHVLRHPTARYASAKRRRLRVRKLGPATAAWVNGVRFPLGMCEVSLSSQALAHKNNESITSYRVLRYEDLVAEPITTMGQAIQWLGIDPHETLQTPSMLGTPTRANTSYWREEQSADARVRPSVNSPRDRFRELTNTPERTIVDYLCGVGNLEPSYAFPPVDRNRVRKAWHHLFKNERIRDVIRTWQLPNPAELEVDDLRETLHHRLPQLVRDGRGSTSGRT